VRLSAAGDGENDDVCWCRTERKEGEVIAASYSGGLCELLNKASSEVDR
jgi:hypothetical protein